MLKLSVGPILYYWHKETIFQFYENLLKSSVDVIYLGEVVCNKRHELSTKDWLDLATRLAKESNKQIVLSSLALSESSSDIAAIRKLVDGHGLLVEANDMAAVNLAIEKRLPYVCGPTLNIYNHATLEFLQAKGACRWVMPVDLDRLSLTTILRNCSQKIETEVFCYGKLPLALSARCFTARNLNLSKDHCEYSCLNYPQGMDVQSQEEDQLFTINGIQTLSGKVCNLIDEVPTMADMGVDIVRLSPESPDMSEILETYDRARRGERSLQRISTDGIDGYWFKQPGMLKHENSNC